MEDKEKEFVKKVNVDKAKNKTTVPIVLISISILTYVFPLLVGEFDFGVIVEIISLAFLLLARSYMSRYDEKGAKICIICSIIVIGLLLIYDLLWLISSMQYIVELLFLIPDYFWVEILSIPYVIWLFRVKRALSKANAPEKHKESTDWFYEKYEKKESVDNKNT